MTNKRTQPPQPPPPKEAGPVLRAAAKQHGGISALNRKLHFKSNQLNYILAGRLKPGYALLGRCYKHLGECETTRALAALCNGEGEKGAL